MFAQYIAALLCVLIYFFPCYVFLRKVELSTTGMGKSQGGIAEDATEGAILMSLNPIIWASLAVHPKLDRFLYSYSQQFFRTFLIGWLSEWPFILIQYLIFNLSLLNSRGISPISTCTAVIGDDLIAPQHFRSACDWIASTFKSWDLDAELYTIRPWSIAALISALYTLLWDWRHAPHSTPAKHLIKCIAFLHLSTIFWIWILKSSLVSIHIPRNLIIDTCSNCFPYILIFITGLFFLFVKHITWVLETPFTSPILYYINSSLHTLLHMPHIAPPFPQRSVICIQGPSYTHVYLCKYIINH